MLSQQPLNEYVQADTMMFIPISSGNSSDVKDSNYYKDLADKYRIDEQYAKNKNDKNKYKKLYQNNVKKQHREEENEKIEARIFGPILIAIVIAVIVMIAQAI